MCAILDANVAGEVFGKTRPTAGLKFFEWMDHGPGRLVLGGHLRDELVKTSAQEWVKQALLAGRIRNVSDTKVHARTDALRNSEECMSNDPHVIALAQISRARLLYTNDVRLHQDFNNKQLIDNPRGKVYSTRQHKDFRKNHRSLLQRRDLCGIY